MQKHKGWIRYTKLKDDGDPKIGAELTKKTKDIKFNTHCAQDQIDEELKDFPNQLMECVQNGKKHFDGDFYIQVLMCLDGVLKGSKKNIFAAQGSCPVPFYDQIVYKYHQKDDHLEYLWVVPDMDLCNLYIGNPGIVPDDEKELYQNIMAYHNGDLAKKEYIENNHTPKCKIKKMFTVTGS